MKRKLQFLKTVWAVMIDNPDGSFSSHFAYNLVTSDVCDKLGSTATVATLASLCEELDAVAENFDRVVSILKRDWDLIRARAKVQLIHKITTLGFQNLFEGFLFLSETDELDLRIQWDVADILYEQEKRELLEEFKAVGVDIEAKTISIGYGGISNLIEDSTEKLICILSHLVEYYYSAVIASSPLDVEMWVNEISGRVNSEFFDMLMDLREVLTIPLNDLINDPLVGKDVEQSLEPFKVGFDKLKSRIRKMRPTAELYSRFCKVASTGNCKSTRDSERTINIERIIMGDKYEAGQVGAQGPGARAHDMTFHQVWLNAKKDIDLQQLSKELTNLRSAMKLEATSVDEDAAIGAVAAAESAAMAGQGPSALQHLRIAGKWALETATKIGTPVASAAIKAALGL